MAAPDIPVTSPAPNVEELRAALDDVWQIVAQVTINVFTYNMPRCLAVCVGVRGSTLISD